MIKSVFLMTHLGRSFFDLSVSGLNGILMNFNKEKTGSSFNQTSYLPDMEHSIHKMTLLMKKTLSLLLTLALCTFVMAQGDPGKDLKKVTRNLANYNLDPAANADALTESAAMIEGVVKSPEFEKESKAWLAYGNVYAENVNSQTQALVLDPNAPVSTADAVTKTYKGYSKALEYAEKGYEKKDALNGLQSVISNMYYLANILLNRQDYAHAYEAYKAVTQAETLLDNNDQDGIFTKEELQNAQFVTGVCANASGKYTEALKYLAALRDEKYDDPGVYEYLYKTYAALGDNDTADAVLSEGRSMYPDDKGLLFAEINNALAKGDLESLVGKLKKALEAEPDNVSIPTTLGNVYDQLYQKALEENPDQGHMYFDSAKLYIQKALDINPDHFDAVYMMGELEYNKAAEIAKEVNALADDYSKEGTKKYDAKKAEMMSQFEKALPYFEHADQLNPKDVNTLIALREIWVRKGDIPKSEEYKARLEAIQGN